MTQWWRDASFAGDSDRNAVIDLLQRANRDELDVGAIHPGDVCWLLWRHAPAKRAEFVRLWRALDGTLLGFAYFVEPPSMVE